jgi:hypothetical protein
MPAIQGWLQSVLGTKDFIHLMFSLMFFTSQLHLKSKLQFFLCNFANPLILLLLDILTNSMVHVDSRCITCVLLGT